MVVGVFTFLRKTEERVVATKFAIYNVIAISLFILGVILYFSYLVIQ